MSFFSFELDPALAADPVFDLHKRGKMAIAATVPLASRDDLSLAYTPGVARVCEAIAEDPSLYRRLHLDRPTRSRWSPTAPPCSASATSARRPRCRSWRARPCCSSSSAGSTPIPICLDTQDVEGIIAVVKAMAPSFGGINLEDISAPRCFEIERRLDAALDIPVFHDDQHGTAVVVLAALRNAVALLGRRFADLRVVISGAGAAGVAITQTLIAAGVHGANVIVCDSRGIIHARPGGPQRRSRPSSRPTTNFSGRAGGIAEALIGADVLIGVSGGAIGESALAGMAPGGIIFALANPTPEVPPALAAQVRGDRRDRPQRLPQPDQQRAGVPGHLPRRAGRPGHHGSPTRMKVAAAEAIAEVVADELRPDAIVPSALDPRVAPAVAAAVARAAERDGVARRLAARRPADPAGAASELRPLPRAGRVRPSAGRRRRRRAAVVDRSARLRVCAPPMPVPTEARRAARRADRR